MPVIRVSDEVDKLIRTKGRFGDTHDSILRSLLGLKVSGDQSSHRAKAKKKSSLSDAHRKLILHTLLGAEGHRMIASQAAGSINKQIMSSSAKTRREKRIQNESPKLLQVARHSLLQDGMLRRLRDSGRVFWQLTEKGIRRAKQLRSAATKRRAMRRQMAKNKVSQVQISKEHHKSKSKPKKSRKRGI